MRRFFVVLVLLAAMAVPFAPGYGQRQKQKPKAAAAVDARGGAEQITADQLKSYLYFIAADAMEGRDTPSRGLDITANFIAMNLAKWGFKPAGDDSTYFQKIALRRARLDPDQTHAEFNGRPLKYGDDFLASATAGTASGRMVYVGDGWVIKSKEIDPYKQIDVKDKIIVYNGGALPKGVSVSEIRSGKDGQDYFSPLMYAQTHGARGAIVIPNFQVLTNWNNSKRAAIERGTLSVAKFAPPVEVHVPVITASAPLLGQLFQGEAHGSADVFNRRTAADPAESFALNESKTISFTVGAKPEEEKTQNVVAVLEGSDPVLKEEYVAIGAHYDHVGTGQPGMGRGPAKPGGDPNDVIYNGADDDGSGTTAILAMAEAVSHNPVRPKRSLLFVWHCGEEKGLWGSDYFTRFPTIPLERIVTQLNIDMIGRSRPAGDTNPLNAELSGPNEIFVIGSKMMSTELGTLSETVNSSYLNVNFNYKYDDPKDPNRFFFRSDHYNYAQKHIPIIFYFDGVHEDYHRSSDSPDKIDYQKMEKVARTIYATMWELANRPARVTVDKQLPTGLSRNE
jgi:Zn-dependent M28 family amino/carboxypeptidase